MFALAQRSQERRISSYKRRRSSRRREETAISGDLYVTYGVLDKHINEALVAERSTPYSVLRTMIDTEQ